jgi:ABC-type transport system involved in Fe-S cluster assembly fused permease/ATPase subunit
MCSNAAFIQNLKKELGSRHRKGLGSLNHHNFFMQKLPVLQRCLHPNFVLLQARYRKGLPPVLKGISFTIPSGSTCGVVGRTGSGKSSLLLVLFDLIEITGGRVLLDGLDVSKVALDYLRRQIAIIPQDPLLFSGERLEASDHVACIMPRDLFAEFSLYLFHCLSLFCKLH